MTTLRKKKRSSYTVIDNSCINDSNLDWESRGLLCYLLSKPDGWVINSHYLATQSPSSKSKVQRILRDLELAGYIRRYKEKDDKGRFTWISEITESLDLRETHNGKSIDGISIDGISMDGISMDGISMDGISMDGKSSHGFSSTGKSTPILINESAITESKITEQSNTPPTPSADEGSVCEGSFYHAELVEEENSQHLSPSPEKTDNLSLVPITYSDSVYSAPCRTTESSTEIFNRTYGNRLTPQVLDAIAGKIIEIYNKAKPNHWVGCAQRSNLLKTRLNAVIVNHYREHFTDLDGAINALSDDVGCCLLNLKDSKFFNSEKFENGNLLWLLSQPAKIAENAEAWRGRSQQSQQQVVAAAVEELEGIPDPKDGHIMSKFELIMKQSTIRKCLQTMINHLQKTGEEKRHPGLPSGDWIYRYFPEIPGEFPVVAHLV